MEIDSSDVILSECRELPARHITMYSTTRTSLGLMTSSNSQTTCATRRLLIISSLCCLHTYQLSACLAEFSWC